MKMVYVANKKFEVTGLEDGSVRVAEYKKPLVFSGEDSSPDGEDYVCARSLTFVDAKSAGSYLLDLSGAGGRITISGTFADGDMQRLERIAAQCNSGSAAILGSNGRHSG